MTTKLRTIGSGMDHPEGVAYSDTHGLFCGGEDGQIYAVDMETGEHREVANTGGFVLGLAFGPRGRLFACDMGRAAVLSIDVQSGEVEDVTTDRGGALAVPNHLAFATDGTLYVSDSGTWGKDDGRIVAYGPSGNPPTVICAGLAFANGLALDESSEALYIVESSTPGISRISLSNNEVGLQSLVIEMPATVPDGIALCGDGSLVIACYRPDAIFTWHPSRGLSTLVIDGQGLTLSAPTNVTFAAARRDRLIAANLAGHHLTELVDHGLQGTVMGYTT